MSGAAPEKIRPVEPIVLLDKVCAWFANTKVSLPVNTGMLRVLGAL